ncbi:MAG: hypothetical protein JXQ71_05070, partial [Verrucomicrobia bacterium]|nr:hypothetical protein [Verrucomicrobiota bacterium]
MHTPKPSEVAVGNVKVRIYCRVQRKMAKKGFKVYRTWQVADYSGGKRKLLAFADRDMARTKATEIATRLANMEGAVLTLKDDDRLSYVRALDVLKPTGIGIERAAAEFADAHGKLGGRSIAEAVNFFVQRNPTSLPRVSVADAVSRLLQAKRKDGMSEAYLADLGKRLNSFKKAFGCDLLIVSAPAINTWLRENWRGRNRNNFRGAVRTLYRFAVSAGFATKDTMDFEQIEVAKEHDYEI